MALYLDSASVEDARRAMELGFVRGITTNPALMAKTGRHPQDVIGELCEICSGTVFYQLTAPTVAEREAEARRFAALRPNVGLKIPCTLENLALAARLADEDFTVGLTAIFSAAQVYLACEAGARYVLPYVNRSTRLLGDGLALVREMRAVIDACPSPTEILAASVKSPEEAVATVRAGAHHLTLPLAVIEAMGVHPLSEQTIAEFAQAGA
jgi:transaldolase